MEYIRYHSTNCYFIRNAYQDILAVDVGWPCTLREYQKHIKSKNIQFKSIKWAIVTHFHMDHAGLITDFLDNNIECFIFENQLNKIDEMEKIIQKKYPSYRKIRKDLLHSIQISDSRNFFKSIGIEGEVIATPGHSEDSISYISNAQEAIIGDLYPENQIMESDFQSIGSWKSIRQKMVKTVYPAHAEIFDLNEKV